MPPGCETNEKRSQASCYRAAPPPMLTLGDAGGCTANWRASPLERLFHKHRCASMHEWCAVSMGIALLGVGLLRFVFVVCFTMYMQGHVSICAATRKTREMAFIAYRSYPTISRLSSKCQLNQKLVSLIRAQLK